MNAALRSEIRKVLSLRSTYVIVGLLVLIALIMDGWVAGYKHGPLDSTFVAELIRATFQGTSALLGLIVLLQITHEYRYNTIYYTMTLARSRTTIFFAKVLVATLIMFTGAALFMALGVASGLAGVAVSGDSLGTQSIAWSNLLTHGGMYVWGAGIYALIIGFILRSQVGAIVVYLFGASIAEQLLGLLLKSNAGYLPFKALEGTLMQVPVMGVFNPEKSMVIVLGWVVLAGTAAWLLFRHRDAN